MTSPVTVQQKPLRPGRRLIVWGVILLLAGGLLLLASIVGIVLAVKEMADAEQYVMPGTHELLLEKPGSYTIYHEHRTTIGGRSIRQQFPPQDLRVTVLDPEGQAVPLRSPSSTTSYTFGSREGRSLFVFDAEREGTFTLSGQTDSDVVVLAVRRSALREIGGLFAYIFGTTVAMLLGIAGIGLLIAGLVQRSLRPAG